MKLPVTLNTTQPISASQRQAVFDKKEACGSQQCQEKAGEEITSAGLF